MLAKQLARRGLVPAGAVAALALVRNAASAALPARLVLSTVRAMAWVGAGRAAAGVVSAAVAALTEGVLKTMSTSRIKLALAAVLAAGLIGAGWGAYQACAAPPGSAINQPAPAAGTPGKQEEQFELPQGPAPVQVLASLGADGKLVIKTTAPRGALGLGKFNGGPGGLVPPGGRDLPAEPGKGVAGAAQVTSLAYDLDDVEVLDTKANKLDKKEVVKLLKDETLAVASVGVRKMDPLHLRVLKDGILIFVLPPQKPAPTGPVQAVPFGPAQLGAPQTRAGRPPAERNRHGHHFDRKRPAA
jgi:hypothetical protein